jgi:uncharacterized protein
VKNITKAVIVSAIYTAVMALGWVFNPHDYGTIDNVLYMIPFLFVLAIFACILLRRAEVELLPKHSKFARLLIPFSFILGYLLLVNILSYTDGTILGPVEKIGLLFLATMLVGIAEEGVYRGYVFATIEKQSGTNKALLYSSVLFGLLHSVNFLAGPSIPATIVQVVLTTLIGYVFGVIYLKTNRNLVLLMTLHGLYDFLVFSASYLAEINNSNRNTLFVMPMLLILWIMSLRANKKEKQLND